MQCVPGMPYLLVGTYVAGTTGTAHSYAYLLPGIVHNMYRKSNEKKEKPNCQR
jgi:hypothetical protein